MKRKFTLTLCLILFMSFYLGAQDLSEGTVLNLTFNGNANDNTVSFLTGTVNNAVLTDGHDGTPSSAYAFNGVDAYISYPHSEVLNFGPSDDFSISIWLKQAVNQNSTGQIDNDIISKWLNEDGSAPSVGTGGYPFVMRLENQTNPDQLHGVVYYARYDGSASRGGCVNASAINTTNGTSLDTAFNDNTWHHYLFIKRSLDGFFQLWVDGVDYGLQDDDTGMGTIACVTTNNAPLLLGARFNGSHHFTGALDNLRIWNRGLEPEEIPLLLASEGIVGLAPGLEEKIGLKVFPNPTENTLYISAELSHTQELEISLYSLDGSLLNKSTQVMGPGQEVQIDLSHLSPSNYWLRIVDPKNQQQSSFPILKQ